MDTQSAIDIIRAGRGAADTAGWLALKEAGERWRPSGYDANQIELRHYYEGKIADHLVAAVRERFPNSGKRMPLVPLNWAKLFAENAAAVYDYPPQRYLERDGKRLEAEVHETDEVEQAPEDTARAIDFASMVREAQLEVVLAEAERRTKLCKTVFLRVHSDSIEAAATGELPKTKVTPFWASDVMIIPHPRCPTSLTTAVALIARVSGADGVSSGCSTWEVWTRGYEDGANKLPVFGPWRCELVTERHERIGSTTKTSVELEVVWDPYPLKRLPWCALYDGLPEGCPFVDVDRNLVPLFDTINGSLMSEAFTVDMCAAPLLVGLTDKQQPNKIALGPGQLAWISRGDDLRSISQTPDLEGMRASNAALVASMAITHRQRPEGFDAQSRGEVASGVALKIKNEPQMKARQESIARAIETERALLAIMIEVNDYFRATSIAGPGVVPVMRPQDPPEYEDKAVLQRRVIDAMDAGLIDDVEARVLSGYSRTRDEAKAALDKISADKMASRPNGLMAGLDALGAQHDVGAQDPAAEQSQQPVPATGDTAVADTALNGAQVSSLLEIVQAVTAGTLPKSTAQAMIAAAFPAIDAAQVASIIGPVEEGSAPSTVV
jgi:hypothetical protein